MKIVVDTNIVFSAILNANSRIAQILLSAPGNFQFYSCSYLRAEIKRHRSKLMKLTRLDADKLMELEELVTDRIHFIDERLIPAQLLISTTRQLATIDPSDTVFVALAKHLKGRLWTGDLELYRGLKAKRSRNIILTSELLSMLDNPESK